MKVCVVGAYAPSLLNFRSQLLKSLASRGHDVLAVSSSSPLDKKIVESLNEINVRFKTIPFERAGLNPFRDIYTIIALVRLLLAERPECMLSYTAKPVIYAGIAIRISRALRIGQMPRCNSSLITGLGYAFISHKEDQGIKRFIFKTIVRFLYKEGLRSSQVVLFQNPDDMQYFKDLKIVPESASLTRVWGSGVDLELFPSRPLKTDHIFLMVSRLIKDKGIREYFQAAKIVKNFFPYAEFQLAGELDPNPAGISKRELAQLEGEGIVNYLGAVSPIQPCLESCRYYVLPSYAEGTPRSVLEAMATGRPIVTTNVPGCRETVIDNVNGFLVPPRDPNALADAMIRLIQQPEELTQEMSKASIRLVRKKYDVHKVNSCIIKALNL